ncbi:hypothetical protein E1H12_10265 [Geitlerinema sp. P-1104]|nr:hypothetical protein [Geitlerinema sp. P-1104]
MSIKSCPCCGKSMLQHIRVRQLYWLCNDCSFEMPIHSFSEHPSLVAVRTGGVVTRPIGQTVA